ncbi:MAG: hypothetical protein QM703_27705 [Gemmatales bacterium]
MGLFYANITVHRAERIALLTELRRNQRIAFISPTVNGSTTVFDQAIDEQDFDVIEQFGCSLTKALNCSALAAVLHDDDVLYLFLFEQGEVIDRYDSLPEYFVKDAEPGPPEGGDGELICKVFNRPDQLYRVEELLRANLLEDELPEILGEQERHLALCEELGLPPYAAALGYEAIAEQYVPEEFEGVVFEAVHQK